MIKLEVCQNLWTKLKQYGPGMELRIFWLKTRTRPTNTRSEAYKIFKLLLRNTQTLARRWKAHRVLLQTLGYIRGRCYKWQFIRIQLYYFLVYSILFELVNELKTNTLIVFKVILLPHVVGVVLFCFCFCFCFVFVFVFVLFWMYAIYISLSLDSVAWVFAIVGHAGTQS